MRKTVSGALSVLKMFKTALHGEKVVHIYWHTSAFSLRLRLSHAMHAITSNFVCRIHLQSCYSPGLGTHLVGFLATIRSGYGRGRYAPVCKTWQVSTRSRRGRGVVSTQNFGAVFKNLGQSQTFWGRYRRPGQQHNGSGAAGSGAGRRGGDRKGKRKRKKKRRII